ncbi:hypothetical protein [Streptomyces sp. NPDC099088]|uniref:hypothetical protein n=1 Tax=Streptomyces sp. NPDC099088 TaxID=3366101 RepID=UPI00382A7E42
MRRRTEPTRRSCARIIRAVPSRAHDRRRAANWRPAPDGPFSVVIRIYGPDPSVLDGTRQLPALTAAR